MRTEVVDLKEWTLLCAECSTLDRIWRVAQDLFAEFAGIVGKALATARRLAENAAVLTLLRADRIRQTSTTRCRTHVQTVVGHDGYVTGACQLREISTLYWIGLATIVNLTEITTVLWETFFFFFILV